MAGGNGVTSGANACVASQGVVDTPEAAQTKGGGQGRRQRCVGGEERRFGGGVERREGTSGSMSIQRRHRRDGSDSGAQLQPASSQQGNDSTRRRGRALGLALDQCCSFVCRICTYIWPAQRDTPRPALARGGPAAVAGASPSPPPRGAWPCLATAGHAALELRRGAPPPSLATGRRRRRRAGLHQLRCTCARGRASTSTLAPPPRRAARGTVPQRAYPPASPPAGRRGRRGLKGHLQCRPDRLVLGRQR